MPKDVSAKNKVTIYVFRGSTCNHCEEALTYLNNHKNEIDENVEIVTYEVWDNANNSRLQDTVATKLGVDIVGKNYGVPFIVIGNQYISGYNGGSTFNKMMATATDYINDEEYQDVVSETVEELNIKVKSLTLNDLFSEPNKAVTIVIYSIFGAIILGFGAMIIFSRK